MPAPNETRVMPPSGSGAASHIGVGTVLAIVGGDAARHGMDLTAVIATLTAIGVMANGLAVLLRQVADLYRNRGVAPAVPSPPET